MNWLAPGFLAGATLIALPVVLHFLRRRQRTPVRFPSLRFLGPTAQRDTRRQQLLRWLTLLLRCLAISLLAAAFARPFFPDLNAERSRVMVVALDNSMSMQATGRWTSHQRWALEQLAELRPGDRAAVLRMQPSPTWIVPLTDDLAAVRRGVTEAQPGFAATRYAASLRVAGEFLAAQTATERTVLWLADDQRIGWAAADLSHPLPAGVVLRQMPPAAVPPRQAALVSLQTSSSLQDGVELVVRQFHPESDQRQVRVHTPDGRLLAEKALSLKLGENHVTLPFAWPTNVAGLRVSLDGDDLPADDTAWIPTPRPLANAVLLDATGDVDVLAHALRSTRRLGDTAINPGLLPEGPWPANAVVVLRGPAAFREPHLGRLDRFFDNGGALWLFADGSPEQNAWLKRRGMQVTPRRAPTDPWHLRDWEAEHPALAAFSGQSLMPLLELEFHQGGDLAGTMLRPVANWPDGKCALAEWNDDGHRLLLAGFPAQRAAMNWPAHPTFVPFVHQAARWLGAFAPGRSSWRVGDTIPLLAESGVWRALDAPFPQPDLAVGGALRVETPGLYEFVSGEARQVFAINIQPEESDLTPWPKPEQLAALSSKEFVPASAAAPAASLNARLSEDQQRLWWWALALVALVLLAELAVANRTTA
jgi:hypothetical protein